MDAQPHQIRPSPAALHLVTDPAIRMLATLGRVQNFRARTIFVNEGDASDAAYILLNGRVKVFVSERDGTEVTLNICGPGELIGDLALDGGKRSASVVTLGNVICVVITQTALREALTKDPEIALGLVTSLIGRIRQATASIKSLALHDVYQRVSDLIHSLATEQDGRWRVAEPLTQQEIANRVGASRDMVSRVLKEMVAKGSIVIDRKIISLNPKPRL